MSGGGAVLGQLLLDLNAAGQTLVLVTHSPDLAGRYAKRTVRTLDGHVERTPRSSAPIKGSGHMRQVTLQMGMSLDGYVASDREHPGVAVPEDAELIRWKANRVAQAGAHLMGRTTYLEMAGYWPHAEGPYAAPMNDIPKIVFSRTLREASWPTTRIAGGDLAAEIAAIKDEPGPDVMVHGGASFGAALAAQRLIDEYCLVIQPVALGSGQALFAKLPAVQRLELIEAKSFECGVVVHIYRPRTG